MKERSLRLPRFSLRSLTLLLIFLGAVGAVLTSYIRARVRHEAVELVLYNLHNAVLQEDVIRANAGIIPRSEAQFCKAYSVATGTIILSFEEFDSRVKQFKLKVNWISEGSVIASIQDSDTLYLIDRDGVITTTTPSR